MSIAEEFEFLVEEIWISAGQLLEVVRAANISFDEEEQRYRLEQFLTDAEDDIRQAMELVDELCEGEGADDDR
jgi:hypothetical protein